MAFTAGMVESMGIDGIHYMGGYIDDVGGFSSTFTNVPFGPEHANREIVVAISLYASSQGPTSVTIGGSAADEVSVSGSNSRYTLIARKSLTSGTSGTVVVSNTAASATRYSLFVYRVVRKTSGVFSDLQEFNTTTQSTSITFNTVTVPAGGVLIGVGNLTETSTVSISGGGALLGGKTDSTDDTGETDFSFYLDGTNYTTSSTPSIVASWSANQYRFAQAVAL